MTDRVEPEPKANPEGQVEEVWVVGQPGPIRVGGEVLQDYPPYRFEWTDRIARQHHYPDARTAAVDFIDRINERGGWPDGPRMLTRTVTRGAWKEEEL